MSGSVPAGVVVVAHPDDEALWCGGWMLMHPDWDWRVVTLCRGSDPDRSRRFHASMSTLRATGRMGDLDDGPDQHPLADDDVDSAILSLLAESPRADLMLTHGPHGEYTRHLRHEECHRAVVRLWRSGSLRTRELWCFAYSDSGGGRCPQPSSSATRRVPLEPALLRAKRDLITGAYGFAADTWEVRCLPAVEAFTTVEDHR